MDPATSAAKLALRTRIREAVAAMPPEAKVEASAAACARLLASAWIAAARTVLVYAPLPDEPDITDVIRELLDDGSTVCVPRINWAAGTLTPAVIRAYPGGLIAGRNGILEPPADAPELAPDALDLVVVPGRAFDRHGARLGRGGGFYDRFLAREDLRASTVGVAFDAQLVDSVPASTSGPDADAFVDAVVTDRRTILGSLNSRR